MPETMLQPEEHVLSTLERDGSRRWLRPRLSHGKLLHLRRLTAYGLIAIFTIVPFIKVGDRPLLLLNIPDREFTILGFTFLPTDTVLLALFMVGLLLSIFLLTALFGRIWCGWACPQTVYMEFLFRPIERLFDGTRGRGGNLRKPVPGWRTAGKYVVYFLICVYLANTFLAYFVGVDKLAQWVRQSPLEHPVPFLIMAFVTGAMMFDFCFFREQLCIIACPYGRFQSVLLDQNSLIVSYDSSRGEPRGKVQKKRDASLPVLGDCIDCGNCVTTCPTGIDIRHGLQMECINCAQCIDACNTVMSKLGRAPNLIRYSSQSRDQGIRSGLIRARTMLYPVLLVAITTLFLIVLGGKKQFDAVVLREPGLPHTIAEDGRVRNLIKLKLTNRSDQALTLTAKVVEPAGASALLQEDRLELQPRQTKTFHLNMLAPRDAFELGRANMELEVESSQQERRSLSFRLIGPYN